MTVNSRCVPAGSVVVLAGHLPWLLHLLLLTDVGCVPDDNLLDRVAGVNNEGSENVSAATVQHVASSGSRDSRAPEEGQWEVLRSVDSHSAEHERLSTFMASNAMGEEDKVNLLPVSWAPFSSLAPRVLLWTTHLQYAACCICCHYQGLTIKPCIYSAGADMSITPHKLICN